MKKITTALLGLTAVATMASVASTATAATAMRCSHQLPPGHHIAKVIDRWAAEIESQSGGDIDVQVFGANSLVGAKKNIVSVAKGDIDCGFSVNFQWGKTLPMMNVTLAPFAFGDINLWRKWPGTKSAAFLNKKLLEKGVHNAVWLFTTNSSVFSSKGKALIKPADFKGLKIRGLAPAFNKSLQALGAAPSSMSGSKVYPALATGVIDAGLTDVAAAVSRKYYEVQDHFTVVPLISVYFHGYVNPKWYNDLSAKSKAAVDSAGNKAAGWAIDASVAASSAAPDQLRAKGAKVHIASAAEIKVLEDIMRPAFDASFAGDDADTNKLLKLLAAE
ncbi:MAG: TRAP transporter substrate-binding protein DctP [Alphaproteobacteria bacterium]|jgi:TRAP-type C4-dicarboxylate transport system substrate-binding protein|nr:TRAP transporter substrate-binding protein DctP [Alphaproteobacteria bacterium]MBT5158873.1 TRAP transporter substrate-binding protein DctP [Alphaproteobacteria bacterium]MBT7746194.1 TRAP transporter substrate-binding protein DctP [Alphaproteobacteria bacterium]